MTKRWLLINVPVSHLNSWINLWLKASCLYSLMRQNAHISYLDETT